MYESDKVRNVKIGFFMVSICLKWVGRSLVGLGVIKRIGNSYF